MSLRQPPLKTATGKLITEEQMNMNIPRAICSKCHGDFLNCKCEQFNPNIPVPHEHMWTKIEVEEEICLICGKSNDSVVAWFGLNELKILYRILEHHYIPYEDQEAHDVVNKISRIIQENEQLAGADNTKPK
jgi:hypothetical protein